MAHHVSEEKNKVIQNLSTEAAVFRALRVKMTQIRNKMHFRILFAEIKFHWEFKATKLCFNFRNTRMKNAPKQPHGVEIIQLGFKEMKSCRYANVSNPLLELYVIFD